MTTFDRTLAQRLAKSWEEYGLPPPRWHVAVGARSQKPPLAQRAEQWLEDSLGASGAAAADVERVRAAALEVLRAMPPADLEKFLDVDARLVVVWPLLGLTVDAPSGKVILINARTDDLAYTIAHEFGHCIAGPRKGRTRAEDERLADELAHSWGFRPRDETASTSKAQRDD